MADLLKIQLSSSKFMYKISILKYGRTNKFNHSRLLTVEQSQQNKSKSTLTFVWEFWKEMWWHFFENSCDDIVIFQFIRWWNFLFLNKRIPKRVDLYFCTPSFLEKKWNKARWTCARYSNHLEIKQYSCLNVINALNWYGVRESD